MKKAVIACVLATAGLAPAAAQNQEPFTVAVLRRDGVAIPFAAFDGRYWTIPGRPMVDAALRMHDEVVRNRPRIPGSLSEIPDEWFGKVGRTKEVTLWTDGKKGPALYWVAPALVPIACGTRMGIRVNVRPPEDIQPPTVQPYPKVGVIVAGNATIDPITAVARDSADWNRIAQSLLEPFAVAERLTVSRIEGWRHPIPQDLRRRVPLTMETLYSAPMDAEGWTAYFVEAVKRYPPGPEDAGCGLITSVSGWVLSGPELKREFKLDAVVSYCDRRDARFFLPFGRVTANGAIYWIYQSAGYDAEHYIVARPRRDRVEGVVGYPAAVCPR
jgi:hypothetical protein